jgi:hypothetical protein
LSENSDGSKDTDYLPFQELPTYIIRTNESTNLTLPLGIFDQQFSLSSQSEPFRESPQVKQESSSESVSTSDTRSDHGTNSSPLPPVSPELAEHNFLEPV